MQLRVLVSTDVLAEGTDVPSCACVVRFDPPTSYVNYVQARAPCLPVIRATGKPSGGQLASCDRI